MSFLGNIFRVNTYIQALKSKAPNTFEKAGKLSNYFSGIARETFENGLSLNIRELPEERLISLKIHLGSGANADPAGKNGLAHFTEHMVFYQNEDFQNTLHKDFYRKGGFYSASTFNGHTEYHFRMPYTPANVRFMRDKILKGFFEPDFHASQIEEERKVILNELNLTQDQDNHNMYQSMRFVRARLLYDIDMSRANYITGSESDLSAITLEDVSEYHAQHYVPNNIAIDVSAPAGKKMPVFRKFQDYLSSLVPMDIPEIDEVELAPGKYEDHISADSVKQAYYAVSFPLPNDSENANEELSSVFQEYIDQMLSKELRGPEGRIAYSAHAKFENFKGKSSFVFTGNILPDDANLILPVIANIMSDLENGKIDHEVLDIAKAQCLAGHFNSDLSIRSVRSGFKSNFERFESRHSVKANLKSVSKKDLSDLAKDLLDTPPRLVTAAQSQNIQTYDELSKMLPLSDNARAELSEHLRQPGPQETNVQPSAHLPV